MSWPFVVLEFILEFCVKAVFRGENIVFLIIALFINFILDLYSKASFRLAKTFSSKSSSFIKYNNYLQYFSTDCAPD